MKSTDIAWLAGIVEGEGCIRFDSTAIVQIGMTDKDVLDKISLITGQRVTGPQLRGTYKPMWNLRIRGNKAVAWMLTLYSMLGLRRRTKIKEVVESWKAMRGSYQSRVTHCPYGHTYSGENLVRVRKQRQCRQCLNRRSREWSAKKRALQCAL